MCVRLSSTSERPPSSDSSILQRYPPIQTCGTDDGKSAEALKKELEKDKPRRDTVLPLMKETFAERRQYILSTETAVINIGKQYPGLLLPYAVSHKMHYIVHIKMCFYSCVCILFQFEQEVDIILKKRDVVRSAAEDWKSKWCGAILAYTETLKSKVVKAALKTVL